MEEISLPYEIIEEIILRGDIENLANLCKSNKYFNQRCYNRTFWAPILFQMPKKRYRHLLTELARLNGKKLLFYIIDNNFVKLSPKSFRRLIEELAIVGNEKIIRTLIEIHPRTI